MNYDQLIKAVAKEHSTDPKIVEAEMKNAIRAAGYDMEVKDFILMARTMVLKNIKETNPGQ